VQRWMMTTAGENSEGGRC